MDLNDDEYQEPNQFLPYPGKRPYPNPLFENDANVDYDGDGLPLLAEYRLWRSLREHDDAEQPRRTRPTSCYRCSYPTASSTAAVRSRRRRPTPYAAPGLRQVGRRGHLATRVPRPWATDRGPYDPVDAPPASPGTTRPTRRPSASRTSTAWTASRTARLPPDRLGHHGRRPAAGARLPALRGHVLTTSTATAAISDDERDEDVDGLTNIDEAPRPHDVGVLEGLLRQRQGAPYPIEYAGPRPHAGRHRRRRHPRRRRRPGPRRHPEHHGAQPQHGLRLRGLGRPRRPVRRSRHDPADRPDGAGRGTDPDPLESVHPADYGRVNPFNPCLPYTWSRTCERHAESRRRRSRRSTGRRNWFALQ